MDGFRIAILIFSRQANGGEPRQMVAPGVRHLTDGPRLPVVSTRRWRTAQVFLSKSDASCRSRSCSDGSPVIRLTMRPRFTAGRARMASAQRCTFL